MAGLLDPIVIRYDGLDATGHQIDLALLGQSLQGAGRLIAVSAHLAFTGVYVSRTPAMSVRVLAQPPQANCYELPASIVGVVPVLPLLTDTGRALAKRALEAIVNYIFAHNAGRSQEAEKAMDVAKTAIDANREVTLRLLDVVDAMQRAANDQRPAVRSFAAPVGNSVSTAIIGDRVEAFVIDAGAKEIIEREDDAEIGPAQTFTVALSELDIKTGSCKVALYGENNGRISAEITDPVVRMPRSPYSAALDAQGWIKVTAKPHIKGGKLEKLTISDTSL